MTAGILGAKVGVRRQTTTGPTPPEGDGAIDSPHLSPISRASITDEIVNRLTSMILDEGLKPGDKLPSERELMVRLSVGRSSLREAIKVLRAVGVVEVSLGEGTFVGNGASSFLTKPLSWTLMLGERNTREVIEARCFVEAELARLAAERASEEEIEQIADRLQAMRNFADDAGNYSRWDLEFHLAIANAAHNGVLAQILHTFRQIIRTWIEKNITQYERKPQSLGEHIPIYEAIRARDGQAARRAMAAHLDGAGARLLSTTFSSHEIVEPRS